MMVWLRFCCDVTLPELSPHLDAKIFFETRFEFYSYQLSNAPSLVSVLKTVLHNFTKHLNHAWWYGFDPVVTSLQPQLSPHPVD